MPYIASPEVEAETVAKIAKMLDIMGGSVALKNENQMDMATAISGCGPAYMTLFLEALVEVGVHIGLSRNQAFMLASRSMQGSAALAIHEQDCTLPEHKYSVTSPGGVTASALFAAEKLSLRSTVGEIVWTAYRRCLEIGDESDTRVFGPGVYEPKKASYSGRRQDV